MRIIRAIVGCLALIFGLSIVTTNTAQAACEPPEPGGVYTIPVDENGEEIEGYCAEDGLGHNAVIRHSPYSDRSTVYICKNWGESTCKSTSPKRDLYRGDNTKTAFGWADADGFYLPSGYDASVTYHIGRFTSTGWHKVSGCGGCTRVVELYAT